MAKRRMLHLDYVAAHTSLLVWDFLTKMDDKVLPQPPHSLHLANGEIFLFPKLKSTLK